MYETVRECILKASQEYSDRWPVLYQQQAQPFPSGSFCVGAKALQLCCDFPHCMVEGRVLTTLQTHHRASIISWESSCSHGSNTPCRISVWNRNVLTAETPRCAAKGFSNWLQHSDLAPSWSCALVETKCSVLLSFGPPSIDVTESSKLSALNSRLLFTGGEVCVYTF